jgi:hypothetical protein
MQEQIPNSTTECRGTPAQMMAKGDKDIWLKRFSMADLILIGINYSMFLLFFSAKCK